VAIYATTLLGLLWPAENRLNPKFLPSETFEEAKNEVYGENHKESDVALKKAAQRLNDRLADAQIPLKVDTTGSRCELQLLTGKWPRE
jgi:hypothetical protein